MSDVPDSDLIEQARAGEQRAFAELYDRYAWSFAQNGADAQELLQETFLTAWSKLGTTATGESTRNRY